MRQTIDRQGLRPLLVLDLEVETKPGHLERSLVRRICVTHEGHRRLVRVNEMLLMQENVLEEAGTTMTFVQNKRDASATKYKKEE